MANAKSSNDTAPKGEKAFVKVLGGKPPEKTFEQIERANSPSSRKPAPNSVRSSN